MSTVALIVTDLDRSFLGLRSALADKIAGRSILHHTVRRAASINQVREIILVHPAGQHPLALIDLADIDRPVSTFAFEPSASLRHQQAHLAAARKWAITAWRGGLGSATAYDELLPAKPLVDAMETHRATAAVLVHGEWCCFDAALAAEQLRIHLDAPDAMKLTFTQAPPGLSALATSKNVLEQLARNDASFGPIFGYNPHQPAIDPIGREANVAVDASVRDCRRRFIYDTPRGKNLLHAIAAHLGTAFHHASAKAVTDACHTVETAGTLLPRLPQQLTLELTPKRELSGPLCPQHHLPLDREPVTVDTATRLFEQLADENSAGDTAVMLGGLGDALLHPQWEQIVIAAHEAGVLGIGIETDLLCDRATIARLLALPIDLVAIRLNADTARTYEIVHGQDRFKTAADNILALIEARRCRGESGEGPAGLPWVVPKLVKTADTLIDMESFFERWSRTFACHPVIEPQLTAAGRIPDVNLMPMAGPKRRPCRQLANRLTVLSDGRVAQCDQDWQGEAAVGSTHDQPLTTLLQTLDQRRQAHHAGQHDHLDICATCTQWHRP